MSASAVYLVLSAVAAFVAIAAVLFWIANRKRIAADTVGRAEEHARQLRAQSERDAESLKKEAQLEAREKTHVLVADAEQKVRDRRQEIVGLEQALADRTRSLADRIVASEQIERDLGTRDAALRELQKRTEAAATKSEQLLADRQRELQRVAGLTADEARDLVLKQIEAAARRDAAHHDTHLDTDAHENTASVRRICR